MPEMLYSATVSNRIDEAATDIATVGLLVTNKVNGSVVGEAWIDAEINEIEEFHRLYYIAVMLLSALGIVLNVIGIGVISLRRRSHCSESRFVLLLSLGFSDMFVCASVATSLSLIFYVVNDPASGSGGGEEPLNEINGDHGVVTSAFRDGDGRHCLRSFSIALWTTAQSVSLLNLLGMAVDHYVAIVKPLHYDAIMRKSHATAMALTFWLVSFLLGAADLYSGAGRPSSHPSAEEEALGRVAAAATDGSRAVGYCEFVESDIGMQPDYVLLCVVLFCLVSMSILYTCVYVEIAAASRRLPAPRRDFGQSRRALLTTWLILGTFLVCWLPGYLLSLFLVVAAALQNGRGNGDGDQTQLEIDARAMIDLYKVHQVLIAVFLLNSLCDPIIYMTHVSKVTQLCRRYVGRAVALERKLQTSREPLTRNTSV